MAKKNEDSTVSVNGRVMTIEERNRRMKLEYVNTGKSLKDIAKKYGLKYSTIRVISCNEKWAEFRNQFTQSVSDSIERELHDKYVNNGIDITIQYHNIYQKLFYVVDEIIEDKKGLLDKQGNLSIYKLNVVVDILTKLHSGQNLTTGFIPRKEAEALQIQKASMALRELLAGVDETEVIDDNFIEALGQAAAKLGMMKEDDNNGNSEE